MILKEFQGIIGYKVDQERMMMVRAILVIAAFIGLAVYALDNRAAMAQCELKHSHSVCEYSLNR